MKADSALSWPDFSSLPKKKSTRTKNLTTLLPICCGSPQYFHMLHVFHYVRLSRVQYAYLLLMHFHLRADHRMTHHWESDLSFFVSEIGFDTVVNLCIASRFLEEIPQRGREKRNTLLTDVWCKDKDKRPRWRMATFNKFSSQKHPLWRTTRRDVIKNIARIANAVQVTICLLVSTSVY